MKAPVHELMVPLEEYASVSEEASLYEAVLALEEAQKKVREGRDKHRAILVYNKEKRIVGKVSRWDLIKALEPKYNEIKDFKRLARFGLGADFVKSMIKDMNLWQKPLDNICDKAGHIKVKQIMYTPEVAEYVHEDTSLNEAIHQLVIGHHQSLLVTRGDEEKVVGILRLSDVFAEVCRIIKSCMK